MTEARMSDTEAQGIAHSRRRNPFPAFNDTEYELFLLTVERAVAAGVAKAMLVHQATADALEQTAIDVDRRLCSVEATITQLRRVTWTAVAALIVGSVGIILALINSPAIGQ